MRQLYFILGFLAAVALAEARTFTESSIGPFSITFLRGWNQTTGAVTPVKITAQITTLDSAKKLVNRREVDVLPLLTTLDKSTCNQCLGIMKQRIQTAESVSDVPTPVVTP